MAFQRHYTSFGLHVPHLNRLISAARYNEIADFVLWYDLNFFTFFWLLLVLLCFTLCKNALFHLSDFFFCG